VSWQAFGKGLSEIFAQAFFQKAWWLMLKCVSYLITSPKHWTLDIERSSIQHRESWLNPLLQVYCRLPEP
jgi:hypothetical protein